MMNEEQRKAIFRGRCGFVLAALSTIAATLAAMNGHWILWSINGATLIVAVALTIINYRRAWSNK